MHYFDLDISLIWHEEAIARIPDGMIKGRNVKEGYSRSCGIHFGNGLEVMTRDPLFMSALTVARQRETPLDDPKLLNLWLLIKYHLRQTSGKAIVEFGTARGGSALFMAIAAKLYHPGLRVLCFDTFEGMPAVDATRDAMQPGDFNNTDFQGLTTLAAQLGLDNILFIKGMLQDTAPDTLPRFGPVALAHIDVDIYDSVAAAYDIVKPHMSGSGYLVFDDPLIPSCLGAFEAVEDLAIRRDGLSAEQAYPHLVFRAP